jgi:uracil-DNA glycosylase
MTLREIQNKLYEKLKPSGWGDKLKMFILSDDFYQILNTLHEQAKEEGKRFTPGIKDIFRAFEECPYNDLKVVIIGQDPYPQAGVADGISFSCSKTGKAQPSLRYIFKEIESTVYPEGYEWDVDLKRWSNQGVLMLNTSLTCEVSKIGSHIELWKPFTVALMDVLANSNTGIIYAFLGKKAQEWHKMVGKDNYKLFTTHPASAGYNKQQEWNSGNLFNQINVIADRLYGEKIVW